VKAGTRQPYRKIVMKCEDRLTVKETEYLIGLLVPHDRDFDTVAEKILDKLSNCLHAAQQASEKAYLIRNTHTRRPKRHELKLVK
jgi:hypothetical protein